MDNHSAPPTISAEAIREVSERSQSGAPIAGEAVSDIFSTDEIFQRIIATADEEFSRSTRLLFLSGIAAGVSISLSFLARAAVTATFSNGEASVVGNIVYPVGFLLIVLGRYQLFTENTLTPVALVLTRIASLPMLFRVWGVVLAANVLGAGIFAFVLANSAVFTDEAREVARGFAEHALEFGWGPLFWKGIFAGFIVASMVWLVHAVRETTSRVFIVFMLMFLIPSADLFHCIIGACETLYLVFLGEATLLDFFNFFTPVVLGNTIGGVLLVAALNFAQTREHRFPDRDCSTLELTWSEWLLGSYTGFASKIQIGGEILSTQFSGNAHELKKSITDDDHKLGPDSAPVTVLVYGDFQCKYSAEAADVIKRVDEELRDDMQVIFRHFPLTRRHSFAMPAAKAAEAAAEQDEFWEMYDILFENYNNLADDDLLDYAKKIGLDIEQFKRDLQSEDILSRVQRDSASGRASGVRKTPTLFINGEEYRGDVNVDPLLSVAKEAGVSVRNGRREAQHNGSY